MPDTKVQRLLIADDQPINIHVLYEIFKDQYEIFMAVSGAQVFDICRNNPPDLILLDIVMPQMDGINVCRELKLNSARRDIPVIFVTARDNPEDETKGLLAGAVDFITKPVNPAVVRARVETHMTLKRQQDMLRKAAMVSERQFRQLFENNKDAIVWADTDGFLIQCNEAAQQLFERRREELIGISRAALHPPRDPPTHPPDQRVAAGAMSRESLHSRDYLNNDVTIVTGTGQIRYVDILSAPITHGEREVMQLIFVDVTARREAQEALLAAKEAAEAASRAKSVFLASMSHELRTPLNAVIGFAEVLQDRFFGPLTERQETYVGMIRESGRHLLALINDVLDLTRIESGKLTLEFSRVWIADLLSASTNTFKEQCQKRGIALKLDISPEAAELKIIADTRSLKQIFYNLITNAVKFTPDQGRITITLKRLAGPRPVKPIEPGLPALTAALEYIEIVFMDNGVGIHPDDQEKIFEEFYQVQGGYKDKTPGTGLGLPLTRRFIAMHHGSIRVESKGLGQGSRFTVLLPVAWPDFIDTQPPELELDLSQVRIGGEQALFRHLDRMIEHATRHNKTFTLCHFKADLHHLKTRASDITDALSKSKRNYDYLAVGRDGTFFLVIGDIDPETSQKAAIRSKHKLEQLLEGQDVSCAIASYPSDGASSAELIQKVRRHT